MHDEDYPLTDIDWRVVRNILKTIADDLSKNKTLPLKKVFIVPNDKDKAFLDLWFHAHLWIDTSEIDPKSNKIEQAQIIDGQHRIMTVLNLTFTEEDAKILGIPFQQKCQAYRVTDCPELRDLRLPIPL